MLLKIKHKAIKGLVIITFLFISTVISFAETITYVYDDLNRLTRVDYGNGTVIEYTYDEVGNRLQKKVIVNGYALLITTASLSGEINKVDQTVTLNCKDDTGARCKPR